MDTDSFIVNIKAKGFYEDIANDVEERFDTSRFDKSRDHCLQERIKK